MNYYCNKQKTLSSQIQTFLGSNGMPSQVHREGAKSMAPISREAHRCLGSHCFRHIGEFVNVATNDNKKVFTMTPPLSYFVSTICRFVNHRSRTIIPQLFRIISGFCSRTGVPTQPTYFCLPSWTGKAIEPTNIYRDFKGEPQPKEASN